MTSGSRLYRYRGWFAAFFGWLLVSSPGMLEWSTAGVLLVTAAFVVRVWTRRFIGEHTRGLQLEGELLYIWGPYSKMRHPLYLSNLLFGWGLILLSGGIWYWSLPLAVVWFLFCKALGDREDRYLRALHTVKWREWASKTPFWGWSNQKHHGKDELLVAKEKRSLWGAFWADRWSWFWQLLLLLLLASPLRGLGW